MTVKEPRLSAIAGALLILGGFLAVASLPFLYFAWHVAIQASEYRPAAFLVNSVEFKTGRRGRKWHEAQGVVNGSPESLPLYDFGPTPNSQIQLEAAYPRDTVLSIMYDRGAPDFVLTGTSLRMLPRTYNLGGSLSIAIMKTLGLLGPFAVGIVLQVISVRREKAKLKKHLEEHLERVETTRAARKARKAEARLRRLSQQKGQQRRQ